MNGTFEWRVVIAIFLSFLSSVPRRCASLTYFLDPKLRGISAKLIALSLRRLRCAGSIPMGRHEQQWKGIGGSWGEMGVGVGDWGR